MKKIVLIINIVSLMFVTTNLSAKELKVGTGGETGNYYSMALDINNYCSEDMEDTTLSIMQTSGSVENLLGLGNKQFSIAIVQEDVLNFNAKRAPKKVNENKIKVITGLHEEAIHLLIPKGYKPKTKDSNMWSGLFSSDKPQKVSLSMLKGQRVGSKGGSIISAEALSYFFGLDLQVFESNLDVNNTSTPILLVGGAPYAPVEQYLNTGKWVLATLNHKEIAQIAPFYSDFTVNYQINGKVTPISTVGVRALMLGKSFRKSSRNKPMTTIATCIYGSVADLADDPDTNPNWSSVYDYIEDEGQSDWSYFPLDEEKLKEYE